MKLSGVMLGTKDPKKLSEFYTKAFGKPGWNQDDWYGWMIGSGSLMIGPHSEAQETNPCPAQIIITFETKDVKGEFDNLKIQGAKVVAEPYQPDRDKSPDIWLATVADPDGNYLQIASPWKE